MTSHILKYLRVHWIYSMILGYFGISILLYLFLDIHILVPCLWKSISGYECPGCGLTTAFMALLQLDWQRAWAANPLIYILVPAIILLILRDFGRFRAAQMIHQ
ncbi:DUF2752 domain-containing protein [Sphingobacterium sp. N143]|uniref:DUF2752 domain-containing protein n=1 Tax=Sphingobacterium sp. N143 TaxID=2746727 RepID=UPI00257688D0|nr:DUF2752 domain-containing protein [Sphingobacterium sp. N143]MDM1292828.1 DUF2752 domain-containing protein [Sphingobacterium sp. N143]